MNTNIGFPFIIGIVIFHYIGDYLFQTSRMALGKSKNWPDLILHTAVYSTVWLLVCNALIILKILGPAFYLYAPQTFALHTIQDYITSRWAEYLKSQGRESAFWKVIGLDQTLHFIQLFVTYIILNNL